MTRHCPSVVQRKEPSVPFIIRRLCARFLRFFRTCFRFFVYLLLAYASLFPILVLPGPQRALVYLNVLNYPFSAELSRPESFGFAPDRVRNLYLKTIDDVRIGVWHVLPVSVYRQHGRSDHRTEIQNPSRDMSMNDSKIFPTSIYENSLRELPVLLYLHGNAGNRATHTRIETYRVLSGGDVGVNVLAVDYRGYGDSGGYPSEAGLVLDARAAWDYLIDLGVPHDRITILGHSLGTGVSVQLAAQLSRDATPPHALILKAAYSSVADLMYDFKFFRTFPLLAPLRPFPYLKNVVSSYLEHRFDSMVHIKDVAAPILLIHGTEDAQISIQHSHSLFTKAVDPSSVVNVTRIPRGGVKWEARRMQDGDRNGSKISLYEILNADHNDLQNWDLFVEVMGEWIIV